MGGEMGRDGPRSLRGLGHTLVKRGVVSYNQRVSLWIMSTGMYNATHSRSGSLLLLDTRTLARLRGSGNPGIFSGLLLQYRIGLGQRRSAESPIRRNRRHCHSYCY